MRCVFMNMICIFISIHIKLINKTNKIVGPKSFSLLYINYYYQQEHK